VIAKLDFSVMGDLTEILSKKHFYETGKFLQVASSLSSPSSTSSTPTPTPERSESFGERRRNWDPLWMQMSKIEQVSVKPEVGGSLQSKLVHL